MKIHSKFVEITIFLLVFLFFLLPSVFFNSNTQVTKQLNITSFSINNIICFSFGLILYLIYKEKSNAYDLKKVVKSIIYIFLTFCLLIIVSMIIKNISLLVQQNSSDYTLIKPSDFKTWSFCIINFFTAAFFEEVIYRFYTPNVLIILFTKINSKKIQLLCSEIISLLFFSLAHYYLGYFSVINAIFAQIILRICYKKNDSIFPCFISHFLYNVISLILL